MISFEREDNHYLNLDQRIAHPLSRFEPMKKAILLDSKYFGITSIIKQPNEEGPVNERFCYYDLSINSKTEEKKIRDLFFAKKIINKNMMHETKYSSIDHISKRLGRSYQIINRITSSIFIKYTEAGEKKTVDIGLKLRNNNQKLHIPIDVIYSEKINNYTGQPTQFWGFSNKAEKVIEDYLYTFQWLHHYVEARAHFEASNRANKFNKHENKMNKLEDAMPFIETEEGRLEELKRLTDWLDNCDLAKRSFVPAGFRFLSDEARGSIEEALEDLKQEPQKKIPSELVKADPRTIFTEMYPFWTPPFPATVGSYRFGDRVANVDTHRRKYIPFGEIGTVVGNTLDSIIVRFDEPNVTLTDVHDTCPAYTGAVVSPSSLINLTQNYEIMHQSTQQNYRHVSDKKGDHHKGGQKNYREDYGKKQHHHGGHHKGHHKEGHGAKTEEEKKKEGRGYTKYGKYNPKKTKKNYKNYDWE